MNEKNLKSLLTIAKLFDNDNERQEIKESNHPFKIGENYFIRTVTMHMIGKLEAVHDTELVLSNASWVADSARLNEFLRNGISSSVEIEKFSNDMIVGRQAIIDATIWNHSLPSESQ